MKLRLLNARHTSLGEPVDIFIRHMTSGNVQVVRRLASKNITIGGLREPPDGLYRVEVDPPSYLPVGAFVNTLHDQVTILVFPIDASKAVAVLPTFSALSDDTRHLLTQSARVLGFGGHAGQALWDALDDIRQAGFMNLTAKMCATAFSNGRTIMSYMQELHEIRGDRFFAGVSQELREETKNAVISGLFVSAPSLLHRPPDGFTHAGSFKTQDRYGNLQLTFFTDGTRWTADVDIDDAGGLEHVFQVLRNHVTGRPTHPFDIHEILLVHQQLDPQYELVPGGRA